MEPVQGLECLESTVKDVGLRFKLQLNSCLELVGFRSIFNHSFLARDAHGHDLNIFIMFGLLLTSRQCPEASPKEGTSAPTPTRHTLWSVLHSTCLQHFGCKCRLSVAH